MSQNKQIISELLDGLDTIRPTLLASKEKNAELRSLLRRMLSLLETLQRTPAIDPNLYMKVLAMLSVLFDAEHGTILKRMHDAEINDPAWQKFDSHLKERKKLVDAAQQDLPATLAMLQRAYDLIGKTQPESDKLNTIALQFERELRDFLQGNSKVRNEFKLLTTALKHSVQVMDGVLGEVGTESPELQHVQQTLERELPSDPKEAQTLLREARSNILKAGQKLSHASQQVKATMDAQVEQMNTLSKRLEHAEAQARNDPLTGLANRRKLREFFETLPTDQPATFLMIDIDHFKHINDKYGHDVGDYVLGKLANLLKVSCRNTDMVARLGGEEFCVVLPQSELSQGITLAETIRKATEAEHFESKHGNIHVNVSIGVAERLTDETIQAWIKRADGGLYHAKNNGRNQVVAA